MVSMFFLGGGGVVVVVEEEAGLGNSTAHEKKDGRGEIFRATRQMMF